VTLVLALDHHLGGVSLLFFLEKIPAVKLNMSMNSTEQDTSQKMTLKSGCIYMWLCIFPNGWQLPVEHSQAVTGQSFGPPSLDHPASTSRLSTNIPGVVLLMVH
jgi:hypothetical protein